MGGDLADLKDPDWKRAQDKVDRATQTVVELLQSEIATDKDSLDHLQRSANATATDAIAGNPEALAASAQSEPMGSNVGYDGRDFGERRQSVPQSGW
jgi:hypothetical protein